MPVCFVPIFMVDDFIWRELSADDILGDEAMKFKAFLPDTEIAISPTENGGKLTFPGAVFGCPDSMLRNIKGFPALEAIESFPFPGAVKFSVRSPGFHHTTFGAKEIQSFGLFAPVSAESLATDPTSGGRQSERSGGALATTELLVCRGPLRKSLPAYETGMMFLRMSPDSLEGFATKRTFCQPMLILTNLRRDVKMEREKRLGEKGGYKPVKKTAKGHKRAKKK